MKKLIIILVTIFATIITFTPCYSYAEAKKLNKVITMGSDVFFPYVGNTTERGYVIEIADKVFGAKGITVDYDNIPWARVLVEVRKGNLSAAPSILIDDAPDFVFPEEPIGKYFASLFTHKTSKLEYVNISSLHNYTLAVIKDYIYTPEIYKYIKTNIKNIPRIHTTYGNDSLKTNISMLLKDRVDVIVEGSNVFWYKIKLMGLKKTDFREIKLPNKEKYFFIGFAPRIKESREYADILSKGIIKLRKTGELKKILNKYGVSDWK